MGEKSRDNWNISFCMYARNCKNGGTELCDSCLKFSKLIPKEATSENAVG